MPSRICLCFFLFLNHCKKESPNHFFVLCFDIRFPFNMELKIGQWQHFHSTLPSPQTELQTHLEPSPPTTTGCKPSTTTTKLRFANVVIIMIIIVMIVTDHSRKLVSVKCFFLPAKISTLKVYRLNKWIAEICNLLANLGSYRLSLAWYSIYAHRRCISNRLCKYRNSIC